MKNSNKLWYRLISAFLAALMIVTALPLSVFAEDGAGGDGGGAAGGGTGVTGIGSTVFVAPVTSLTASAWQMKMTGAGSISMEQVTDTAWNSTSDSGVQFFYTLTDGNGGVFSNNTFSGGTALPSEYGAVSYCYVYYAENPATAGKGLYNVVPVGMTQSSWQNQLMTYEGDFSNYVNGGIDYTDLYLSLDWVSASESTLPLAYSLGGAGSIVYEPHYYSVFVRCDLDGTDPYICTDNSVVYVHDGAGGGAGGEGGTGEGGGTVSSGFVAPAVSVRANPCAYVNGVQMQVSDAEYESVSDSGVRFCYFVVDSNYAAFGSMAGQTPLDAADGVIEYAFVYSDDVPSGGASVAAYCPVGMTAAAWQTAVADYEYQQTGGNPRVQVDYTGLLATLNWTTNGQLTVYSDDAVYGTSTGVAPHYTNRFYGAFLRWTGDTQTVYSTDVPLVYLHEKAPDVVTSPVNSAFAIPCSTSNGTSVNGTEVIIPRTASETGVAFRYSLTDCYNTVWSTADALNPHPADPAVALVEYLWTYTDSANLASLPAGRTPIGMSELDWNTARNAYMEDWIAQHPGIEPDYSDFIIDLPGWTTDPALPLFDDATVYGEGGSAGGPTAVYSSRYYSCMVRVTFLDGSGYRKAFINTGYYVRIRFGTVGAVNAPVTIAGMELRYYDTSKHIYDYVWQGVAYPSVEPYTDYVVGYLLTDDLGQQYSFPDYGYPALAANAHLEYLWNYISVEDYNGNSGIVAIGNIFPGWNATPCGMTKTAWQALTDGKSDAEKNDILATLSGWAEDNRMPTYSKGEREGTDANRGTFDRCYYSCYVRLVVDGQPVAYYHDCNAALIGMKAQTRTIISDRAFTIGYNAPDSVTLDFSVTVSDMSIAPHYQWYEADSRNANVRTPLIGETGSSLTIVFESGVPHDKYYFCSYYYNRGNGHYVQGESNVARVCVTNAPTGFADANTGKNYYFDDYRPYGAAIDDLHSAAYGGGSLQTVGSQTTISARWYVVGNCSRVTWQWYETDESGALLSTVGAFHSVNDPFEFGSTLNDGNRKVNISISCPATEVGTKYYRVVVTNYEPGGESFTCESNVVKVETLPAENRENLFDIDENGRLTRYYGFEDEVVIPSAVRGIPVTAIGACFVSGVNIPCVVIPEGVITIEDEAFRDCFALREIVLPGTLQSIGKNAFQRCCLASLTIPEGVQTIHKEAFRWAFVNSAEVTVNAADLTVNKGAFAQAYMKKIVFNCTVALALDAEIDSNSSGYGGCFDSCPNLYFFGFPEGISVETHVNTLYDCPKLAWVDNYDSIAGDVKSRGICYGEACCLVKSGAVRFGDWICVKDYNLKDDGSYASASCGWSVAKKLWSSETVVTLPETLGGDPVTGWGCGTFYSYGSRVIYSDLQTELAEGCHVNLTDSPETLTEVILPVTIRHISDYCALGYSALTTVNFAACPNLSRIGMSAFENCPLTGAFTLSEDVFRCSIGESAFKNTALTSACLDGAVLYPSAFNFCYQLAEVTGNWRVETANNVRELYNLIAPRCGNPYPKVFAFFFLAPAFPDTYNYTHYGKTRITDENAAYVSAATGYEVFRMYNTGNYWYSGTPDNATIRYYVGYDNTAVMMPAMIYNMDQKEAYHVKTVKVDDDRMKVDYALTLQEGIEYLDGYCRRAASVSLPEGLRSFGHAFAHNKVLTELYIPSTVTEIENAAFSYGYMPSYGAINIERIIFAPGSQCTFIGGSPVSLCSINLPDGLETIGRGAFANTGNLKSITLPDTLRSIGKFAFSDSGLESLALPSSLLEIGDRAFADCDSLTSVVIPDSVRQIGTEVFDNCDSLVSVTLPDSMTEIPNEMFFACESLTTVNIPASCRVIGYGAFEYCYSLQTIYIPFGVNRIEERAFYDTGLWSLYVPASVDFIGYNVISGHDKKADDPTMNMLSHSSALPLFERETFISPSDPKVSHVFCYEGSNSHGAADRAGVSYSFLAADDYRLLELFDGQNDPVSSEQVVIVKWYDEDAGTLIYSGRSLELPASMANVSHAYRCEVTFTDAFIVNNVVGRTETYLFASGEMRKTVHLDPRPDVTITFTPPQYYGTSFLLTVEYPDGNKYYSTTNTTVADKPAFTLTTKWFPTTLTVSAENFDTLTLTDAQGPLTAEEHIVVDLGEIALTPNGPLLHYRISYHAPGEETLFNISREIPGTYRLYNYTQDRDVTAYMLFEAGTFLTVTNDAVNVGDALYLSFVPEAYTQEYGVENILFAVPWANGSGELTTTRQTRGTVRLTANESRFFFFDDSGNDILKRKTKVYHTQDAYQFLPGTYRLLAFREAGSVLAGWFSDAGMEQILGMGFSPDELYDTTVTVVSGETTPVGIPLLTAVTIPDLKVSASASQKGGEGEYAPVTVNFSFDSSLADVPKKIVISYSGSGQKNPFLEYGGHYAWSFGDTLMTGASLVKPHELNYGECNLIIDVDSLSGSVAFYGIKAHMFRIHLNAGVYNSKYDIVFTPRLDGDLSEWWVSTLPSMIGGSSVDTIPVKVYHPRLGQYHYFRVYRNGELIEETLGCGYTAEIAPSSAGGMTTVNIPAENLAEKLNVVEYDFTVSTREKDPAIFTFGLITFTEGADESNTRVFDSQTVTYYPRTCDVPTPVRLTINVTNNNGISKHSQGSVSLDGSEPDVPIYYMFYNESFWGISNKTTGYMNNDGILTEDMVYDFALTVYKPEMVKDQTAVLTVFCGETSEDPFFKVVLHRNPVTGTFDGQLVLEGGNYTRDQLPAYFDIDFLYDVPEQDDLTTETVDAAAKYISDAEKWLSDVQEHMALDAEALAPIDTEEFLNMLSAVAPAGAAGEEILATAQDVCDYQNLMAGYYASMTDQLQALIAGDEFSQAILNDGFIAPALFGDSESAITVYKELELEQDLLLESGFTAYPGINGAVYYVLQSEKGAAFYDPASQMLTVNSYDKNDPLTVGLPGVGAKKMLKKFGTAPTMYVFDENLIGYGGAASWLNMMLEQEKAYYDEQFGISVRTLDDYVNKIYQTVSTVKMFIDLSKETVAAFQAKLDEANLKNFKNCFDILPEEYKNSTAFAAETNSGIVGKNSKAYAAALEEASDFLDGVMKKLYEYREKLKTFYTGAVNENKAFAKLDELMKDLKRFSPKSKVTQFAKGAASGLGTVMVVFDVLSGLSTIVDAYNMYLGKINGNLYNQFGWMVNRLLAMPSGPFPGQYSDQYKACVHACFDYAYELNTLRGYYTAAYYKEVVSFVITLAADIVGAVRPDVGLAVGIANWSLGNVAEIFTKGVAGLHEVKAGKLEDRVSNACIGQKEDDDGNNGDSGSGGNGSGGGGGNSKQTSGAPIDSNTYIDPAGYVYEAVASNRVPGVTVTCYYKGPNGELLLWDASESDQENPLVTDANGEYQWFVPIGDWRVVAEKDGYLVATSENDPAAVNGWLPVPPPQMEVYIPIVSTALPTVQSVQAGADYIRIEFSQYMDIDELDFFGDQIVRVTDNGTPVQVDYNFIDREVSPTNSLKYYGRILYLTRHDGQKFSGDGLGVFVSRDFYNYAGNGMAADYESDPLAVVQIAGTLSHSYPNRFAGSIGEEADIVVRLLDTEGNPMAGATVNAESSGGGTLMMPDSVVTDENGRAVFHTTVASSGYDTLTFTSGDASVKLETYVNPIGTVKPAKPAANLSDFETVPAGAQLVISCATEGAVIRYTVDNSCPCDENALIYDGPITITEDVFVRIAAWTQAGGYSERLNLHVICGAPNYGDANGDSTVDTMDLTLLRQYLADPDETLTPGMDANADSVVDTVDLTLLRQYLADPDGTVLGPAA